MNYFKLYLYTKVMFLKSWSKSTVKVTSSNVLVPNKSLGHILFFTLIKLLLCYKYEEFSYAIFIEV